MRTIGRILTLAAALGLAACQATTTYKPEYVKPTAVPASEKIDGKGLLYFEESYANYIYNEGASTFTGSGAKLSVPLGLMTREIGKTVYGEAFTDGVDVTTVLSAGGAYRVTIQPKVTDFKYYFHQLENLGFAITPGTEMSLTVKLLDPAGSEIATRTYASGEKKGGSYMISGSPEEKISKLTHEVIAELMQKSLVDIRAWAAAHPRTQ
jgi:hypothetical protein